MAESASDVSGWLDSLPLSRPRRNLARDFSDGVMMAEVLHIYYPKLVDMHNYDQALKVDTKIYNWKTLNQKVFKRIGATIDTNTINGIANAKPGVIDTFLAQIKEIVTTGKAPGTAASNKSSKKEKKVVEEQPIAELPKPMTDSDRELLIEQIKESAMQTELIRALEAKEAKLMELMKIKDAKILKLMSC